MVTGTPVEEVEYRSLNPEGRAILKATEYLPPHEPPSDDYPYRLITGRTVYHFHTRTKTARAPELQAAAPYVWTCRFTTATGTLLMRRTGGLSTS